MSTFLIDNVAPLRMHDVISYVREAQIKFAISFKVNLWWTEIFNHFWEVNYGYNFCAEFPLISFFYIIFLSIYIHAYVFIYTMYTRKKKIVAYSWFNAQYSLNHCCLPNLPFSFKDQLIWISLWNHLGTRLKLLDFVEIAG